MARSRRGSVRAPGACGGLGGLASGTGVWLVRAMRAGEPAGGGRRDAIGCAAFIFFVRVSAQEAEAKAAEEEKKKAVEAMYQAAKDYGKNKAEGGSGGEEARAGGSTVGGYE